MSVVSNNILAGSSGQGGAAAYEIERSLRFNSADTPKLTRTPSSASNQKTWTLSFWMKRTTTGSREQILSAAGTHNTYVEFQNDKLMIEDHNPGLNFILKTTRVFRDPSSWYSVIFSVDTTQATASNRIKLYINGVQETAFDSATYPSQNYDTSFNDTGEHKFGQFPGNTTFPFNGYLADVHFIDGQALAPTDFGETDSNGVWQAKKFVPSSPNNDTTWSNNVTGANNATNGFNGNLSDELVSSSAGGTITFTASFSGVSTFRYYTSNSSAHTVGFNGGAGVNDGGGVGWRTVTPPSSISSIEITHTNSGATAQFAAIQINSVTLIDGVGQYGRNGFHLPFSDNSANAQLGLDYSQGNPGTNNKGMEVVTYTGNGTGQSIDNLSFQPDLVWIKSRSQAYSHNVYDAVRGADKALFSDTTNAETAYNGRLTSFDSSGFTLGNVAPSAGVGTNENGTTYVAWCWKAGGTAATNTDGSITSQVSASNEYGFSVVSYTGATNAQTVGHGLSSAPKFIIAKNRDSSSDWIVYHESLDNSNPEDKFLRLNQNSSTSTSANYWGAGGVTNSVFGVDNGILINSNGQDVIAYCWSEVSGFSKFGSYTGTGSANKVVTGLGFKPRFLIIKRTTGGIENWQMVDSARGTSAQLFPDLSNSETTAAARDISFQDDGFTLIGTHPGINNSGDTYIYAAFADNPGNDWQVNNLVATAGLETANQGFDAVTYTGNGSTQSISSFAFQPDFVWLKNRDSASYGHRLVDSVRGSTKYLMSHGTSAEATDSNGVTSFNSDGFSLGSSGDYNLNGNNFIAWAWKAGGAAVSNTDGTITSSVSANQTYGFSIVKNTYSGSYGFLSVGHGLGKTPSLVISKRTDSTGSWLVHTRATGSYQMLSLNTTDAATAADSYFSADDSTFSLYHGHYTDNGHEYVHYCWSEVSGFSKFGSYTGNGSATGPVVTTGFKPKFVLIKESSAAGQSWQLHDAARGGNKNLQANSSAAESTFTSVEFNNSGFSIKTSDNGWNRSGGTYIYAAFADKPPSEIIDSLIDTPTNYEADSGNNGGNYCTWNPLNKGSSISTSDGNLKAQLGSTGHVMITGTIGMTSGKYYWEVETNGWNTSNQGPSVGVVGDTHIISTQAGGSPSLLYRAEGIVYDNNSAVASSQTTYTTGDIIGVALDLDNNNITWYKNGGQMYQYTSVNSSVNAWLPAWKDSDGGGYAIANFGQRPFAYTPPAGYKSLCTSNLSDPTISDPSQYFDTKLYTGNASSNTISGLNFAPDFLWLKSRGSAQSHALFDLVRGSGQRLQSNATSAEDAYSSFFTGFTSDGFTLNQSSGINQNNDPLVGWAWDAGTSTVTNNDGSIASQVRAQPSAGFSIVAYTGTGSTATWGHGLNSAPELVIIKSRSDAQNWAVYSKHTSGAASPAEEYGFLNSTNAFSSSGAGFFWNNTLPTSSVVTVGSDNTVNGSSKTYVAYCFSPVEGYSAFGSYTGNGSADGTFVYTGHRSRFLLIKAASIAGEDWVILDTARETFNAQDDVLFPNLSSAEVSNSVYNTDILSNGFKLRGTNPRFNQSGVTYIYASFAENPFKTARAR